MRNVLFALAVSAGLTAPQAAAAAADLEADTAFVVSELSEKSLKGGARGVIASQLARVLSDRLGAHAVSVAPEPLAAHMPAVLIAPWEGRAQAWAVQNCFGPEAAPVIRRVADYMRGQSAWHRIDPPAQIKDPLMQVGIVMFRCAIAQSAWLRAEIDAAIPDIDAVDLSALADLLEARPDLARYPNRIVRAGILQRLRAAPGA